MKRTNVRLQGAIGIEQASILLVLVLVGAGGALQLGLASGNVIAGESASAYDQARHGEEVGSSEHDLQPAIAGSSQAGLGTTFSRAARKVLGSAPDWSRSIPDGKAFYLAIDVPAKVEGADMHKVARSWDAVLTEYRKVPRGDVTTNVTTQVPQLDDLSPQARDLLEMSLRDLRNSMDETAFGAAFNAEGVLDPTSSPQSAVLHSVVKNWLPLEQKRKIDALLSDPQTTKFTGEHAQTRGAALTQIFEGGIDSATRDELFGAPTRPVDVEGVYAYLNHRRHSAYNDALVYTSLHGLPDTAGDILREKLGPLTAQTRSSRPRNKYRPSALDAILSAMLRDSPLSGRRTLEKVIAIYDQAGEIADQNLLEGAVAWAQQFRPARTKLSIRDPEGVKAVLRRVRDARDIEYQNPILNGNLRDPHLNPLLRSGLPQEYQKWLFDLVWKDNRLPPARPDATHKQVLRSVGELALQLTVSKGDELEAAIAKFRGVAQDGREAEELIQQARYFAERFSGAAP